MYIKNIDDNYKNNIYTNLPIREMSIYINDTKIDGSMVRRIAKEHQVFGGEVFCLGSCTSTLLTLEVDYELLDEFNSINEVYLEEKVTINNSEYAIPIGYFYTRKDLIDKTNANFITIKLYDKLYFLNNAYATSSSFIANKNKTRKEVVENICELNGMYLATPNFLNGNIVMETYNDELSYQQYLVMISERAGGYCKIGRTKENGKLPLYIKGVRSSDVIEIPEEMLGEYTSSGYNKITKVVKSPFEEKGSNSGDSVYLSSDNILEYGNKELNNIYSAVMGFDFDNGSIQTWGDSNIDDEDFISVNNLKIMAQPTMEYCNGWYGTYQCNLAIAQNENENTNVSGGLEKKLLRSQILAKVSVGDVVASLNLEVENDKSVVELKGNTLIVESDNFSLDQNGDMTCSNAKLNGGLLELEDNGATENASIKIYKPVIGLDNLSVGENLKDNKLFFEYVNDIDISDLTPTEDLDFFPLMNIKKNGEEIELLSYAFKSNDEGSKELWIHQNLEDDYNNFLVYEFNDPDLGDYLVYTKPIEIDYDCEILSIANVKFANNIFKVITKKDTTSYSSYGMSANITPKFNYTYKDTTYIENIWIEQESYTYDLFTEYDYFKYDLNEDKKIDEEDLNLINWFIQNGINAEEFAKFEINTQNPKNVLNLKNSDGNENIRMSFDGIDLNNSYIQVTNGSITTKDENNTECIRISDYGLYINQSKYTNKLLWEATGSVGGVYMTASQTAKLYEKISNQLNGIILVWWGFDPDTMTLKGGPVKVQVVPKNLVGQYAYESMYFLNYSYAGTKTLKINNSTIVGHDSNTATGTGNCGIKYNNNRFVLKYVYGF